MRPRYALASRHATSASTHPRSVRWRWRTTRRSKPGHNHMAVVESPHGRVPPPTPRPQGVLHDLGLAQDPAVLIAAVKAGLDARVFVDLARRLGVSEARLAETAGIAPTTLTRRDRPARVRRHRARRPRGRRPARPPRARRLQLKAVDAERGAAEPDDDGLFAWRLVRLALGSPGLRRRGRRLLRRGRAALRRPLERPRPARRLRQPPPLAGGPRDARPRRPPALRTRLRRLRHPRAAHPHSGAALSVPSVLVPQERNLLIDPAHPRFGEVVIGPPHVFRFDERLAAVSPAAASG